MSQLLEGGALGASHCTPLLSLHHSQGQEDLLPGLRASFLCGHPLLLGLNRLAREIGEHPHRVERGMLALASGNSELKEEVAHPKIRAQPLIIQPHMGLDPKAPLSQKLHR